MKHLSVLYHEKKYLNTPSSNFFQNQTTGSQEIKEIMNALADHLPANCSLVEKVGISKEIKKLWTGISSYFNQPPEKKSNIKKQNNQSTSNFFNLLKYVPSPKRLLACLALMAISLERTHAMPLEKNISIQLGIPKNGTTMCDSLLNIGCANGYIQNENDATPKVIAQFSRLITGVNGLAPNYDGYYVQLKDCNSIDKIGSVILQHLQENSTLIDQNMTITPAAWFNDQVTINVQANGPFFFDAASLGKDLTAAVKQCQSLGGSILKEGEIAGIAIGACAAVGVIAIALFCCYKKCKERNESEPRAAVTQP